PPVGVRGNRCGRRQAPDHRTTIRSRLGQLEARRQNHFYDQRRRPTIVGSDRRAVCRSRVSDQDRLCAKSVVLARRKRGAIKSLSECHCPFKKNARMVIRKGVQPLLLRRSISQILSDTREITIIMKSAASEAIASVSDHEIFKALMENV